MKQQLKLKNIPEGWEEKDLLDMTKLIKDISEKGSFPYIEISDIDIDSKKYQIKEKPSPANSISVQKDDIIISKVRPTRGAISKITIDSLFVSPAFSVLRSKIDLNYLFFYLSQDLFFSYLGSLESGTTYPSVNDSDIQGFRIKFPKSIKEQGKIASILQEVDNSIEGTQNMIDKYKRIKDGLILELFSKGLNCIDYRDSEFGEIPKNWDLIKLGEIVDKMTNGFVGVATPHYTENNEGIIYLYGNNIRKNKIELINPLRVKIAFHKKQNKSQLKAGDLLTVQSGHIGTTAVVPEDFGEANCHALIITRLKENLAIPNYVAYYCNSQSGMLKMSSIFIGSTIKHINIKEFKDYLIPLPKDLKEQKRIVDILTSADNKIESEEKYLDKIIKIKKGLMQDLLTGKVRVKVEK